MNHYYSEAFCVSSAFALSLRRIFLFIFWLTLLITVRAGADLENIQSLAMQQANPFLFTKTRVHYLHS